MRNSILNECIVDKYILRLKSSRKLLRSNQYLLLFAVADALYSNEIELIRSKKCPFCFKSFKNIVLHLKRSSPRLSPCAVRYSMMLHDIVSVFTKLNNRMNIIKKSYRIELRLNNDLLYFKSKKELVEFIRRNPSIIKQLE